MTIFYFLFAICVYLLIFLLFVVDTLFVSPIKFVVFTFKTLDLSELNLPSFLIAPISIIIFIILSVLNGPKIKKPMVRYVLYRHGRPDKTIGYA